MIQNLDFTFIGKNSKLKGDFVFQNETKLTGDLEGTIDILDRAKLTLEIGSKTIGIIKCFDIDIYGIFEGEIISKGHVSIFPTADVNGKIMAQSLEVLPGANLNMVGHAEDLTENL